MRLRHGTNPNPKWPQPYLTLPTDYGTLTSTISILPIIRSKLDDALANAVVVCRVRLAMLRLAMGCVHADMQIWWTGPVRDMGRPAGCRAQDILAIYGVSLPSE